jgi:hypothetical protein
MFDARPRKPEQLEPARLCRKLRRLLSKKDGAQFATFIDAFCRIADKSLHQGYRKIWSANVFFNFSSVNRKLCGYICEHERKFNSKITTAATFGGWGAGNKGGAHGR